MLATKMTCAKLKESSMMFSGQFWTVAVQNVKIENSHHQQLCQRTPTGPRRMKMPTHHLLPRGHLPKRDSK
jgi:hypothetical protein